MKARSERPKPRPAVARLCALLVVAAALALVPGCGSEEQTGVGQPDAVPAEIEEFADEWPAPNGDYHNRRVATTTIDSGNVADLGVEWTAPIRATGQFGGFASTPIIADGVVYTQELDSDVQAYDLETGRLKWEHKYSSPTVGPNGVAIGYGKVYGATATHAFALDMETGEEVWRSERLTRNANEGIDMAPLVYDGKVFVSTVPGNVKGFYEANGVGILHALDAETGERVWRFFTVPEDLWAPEHRDINSGGGLWHTPGIDENGDMYVSVANPAPWPGTNEFPWGTSRPGPNLYTNSLVKLDPDDGSVEWHYQALPHDVWDWDLQLPPIIAEAGGRKLIVTGGKMGYVYAVDTSGDLVWKTPVGVHNGHDRDNELALAGKLERMPKLPVTILPGIFGGVETQMAVADGTVYAAVVNLPTTFHTQERFEIGFAQGKGAGRARPRDRRRPLEAGAAAARVRGGDDRERPRADDDVRRRHLGVRPRDGQDRLARPAAGRHERASRRRRRLARRGGGLSAERHAQGADRHHAARSPEPAARSVPAQPDAPRELGVVATVGAAAPGLAARAGRRPLLRHRDSRAFGAVI